MLYLEAPFFYVNGVSVYSDHADPLQYYYLPVQPRLRTTRDAAGRDVPRLQLLKYRSLVAGSGGFLTFDVHLGLSEAEVDDIAGEIQRLGHLDKRPRLVPLQAVGGSVHLLVMGADSSAGPAVPGPGEAPPPIDTPFVRKIQGSGKPALFGDNGASFSVQLDGPGTAIMAAALEGEVTPAIVVYSLDFIGLRPAFSVRLSIDWDRVQTSLDRSFGNEGLFTSVQISQAVDKLVEDRAIVMEADDFVPDADDTGKAVAERFESARKRVQDMITDSFFTASLPPNRERPDGWDKASELITDVGRRAALLGTGIGAVIGTFSYRKDSYQRIDRRRLDVTVSERSAVLRTIYPQGTLSGIVRALEAGVDRSTFIREVDADDPFFAERRVRVINRGEMARDELASITGSLDYGSDTRTVLFTETGKEDTARWLSIVENGAVKRPVAAHYTVAFKPDPGGERPLVARSATTTVTDDVLEIQPAELYSRVTIPVTVSPNYPWDRYPRVQVRFRYEDPDSGIRTDDTVQVAKGDTEKHFGFLALDKSRRTFGYRVLHRAADNDDVDSGWIESDGDLVDVLDPFGALRLKVDVVPVVSRWADVEQIFVDLDYEDAANDVHESASLAFTPQDHATKSFLIDRKDRTRNLVSFRVTTIFAGGIVNEVPPSFTQSTRILVRTDMKGHRIVAVSPPGFSGAKLERVEAELRYQDQANGISAAERFVFDASGGRRVFEFDYVDQTRTAYEWRATYLFANGMTQSTPWSEADGNELVLPVP